MNEKLLQFIWEFQYFQQSGLFTSQSEALTILNPGKRNHHQGPDFLDALIRIGNTTWAGNIEIHTLASDWYKHHHTADKNYAHIILHVVWEEDVPVYDGNGHLFASLALQNRVSKYLLDRYRQVMENNRNIPCYSFLPALQDLGWIAWKERLAAERLERKSAQVLALFKQNGDHWEELCWCMMAANFGGKVNGLLFKLVAESIPIALLQRHRKQLYQVEALLMGQANLLEGKFTDKYACLLQKEYRFLKKKYRLQSVNRQPAFLRMRPAGFPTIRMAQLAVLISGNENMFSILKEYNSITEAEKLFTITAGSYWDTHYRFEESSHYLPKQIGKSMSENILINTVIPLLFSYGLYHQNDGCRERALQWLAELPAEENRITTEWRRSGISNKKAIDSQALLELTNHYCLHKRCLSCAVGSKILKGSI